MLRSLIDLQSKLRKPTHRIRLTRKIKTDIQYFCQWCSVFNGVVYIPPRDRPLPDTTVYTDASLEAGAAFYNGDYAYSAWEADFPGLVSENIFVKELCAVWIAFRRWCHQWSNKCIHVFTDNKGTEWSLRKGSTKNTTANEILREILWLCAIHNITLCVYYIDTKANYIADALSRLHDKHFFVKAVQYLCAQSVPCVFLFISPHYHMSNESLNYVFKGLFGVRGNISLSI